ncbi:alkaline phosphatase [Corynebacterium sp. LK2590]|uniref:alkaline phosphatase n=1 Tax=unclassified Corynebacterium TaxID=2624378 RepID=UPI0034CE9BF4
MRFSLRAGSVAVAASLIAAGVAPATAQESNGPKNIIYMIGDGMGYGHVAYNNLYETGQSKYLVDGEFSEAGPQELDGESVQAYEDFNRLSMSTYSQGGSYDPSKAWATHDYVQKGIITDSAAAGTAMATGVKVENGVLGMSNYGMAQKNFQETAMEQGKSAGVVSSVPFSHATPAAFAAHNQDRNAYGEIAKEMIDSDLSVVMGAGHPFFDKDAQPTETGSFGYINEADYNRLAEGETDWEYFDSNDGFASLAEGNVEEGKKYWSLAPVHSTLQQERSGEGTTPYSDPQNDVVDLPTMTTGALNALGQDEDGFSVMIEGGAIDWTGHANQSAREIEEMQDFNASVDAAIQWVEENSNWDETLLIVTADHETGYLSGENEPDEGRFNQMAGDAESLPSHQWYSDEHTNQLVPFFFKGAGSEDIISRVKGTDPVRGDYIDNTDVAQLAMKNWWSDGSGQPGDGNQDDNAGASQGSSNAASGLAGAGIVAAIFGAIFAAAQAAGILKIDFSPIQKLLRQIGLA